ncbi:FG-GAP repeat domain-containing protein [Falsirhodobacter algicola]|uniref:VCBS repeat-containing protein n=1 Tax=Falsirhodobacter algicola TaxID=2692330 RepID=A0A8J8MV52_9RHOB|nr:VCBS repeat-containing protein [Falsirhodobacter algicola]QUS37024.1 VCBS repeat-containing protein [Falsirhodobacter algicola]
MRRIMGWGAALALCLAGGAAAQTVQAARLAAPTDRYPHGILGSIKPQGELVADLADCGGCAIGIRLPQTLVFEDFAPRLVDLDGDGRPEIVVVESDLQKGSRLAVWTVRRVDGAPRLARRAATAFLGTRFRWLAPVGAADLDGDGRMEIAYVEKPHLEPVLRILRLEGDRLVPVAAVRGVSNHAIGQEQVASRIERCPNGPRILAFGADGRRAVSVRLGPEGARIADLGPVAAPWRLPPAPSCDAG